MTIRNTLMAAGLAALLASPALAQQAAVPPPPPTEWRAVAPDNLLVIDTTKGRILVELTPEIAPAHVERIKLLASRGFYDNLAWHRVIDWFMAQTGDPLGTGDGQSWYPDLKAEFTFRRGPDMAFTPAAAPAGGLIGFYHSLPVQTQPDALMAGTADRKVHGWGLYCPGVAGMARDEGNDTANSQFFLMRQAYPALDKRYTVWGRVVVGLEVVRALKASPNPDGVVTDPDRMTRVRLASDLPSAERPAVQMLNTTSPTFRALVNQARQAKGADFSVCDIDVPVRLAAAS
ncbi:MAG: peptidylprolyl isomerase [Alphaproteobacteria bacterium]|uniref:peptidylprolyl isomerase n=1 Tax=Brevundimonas mediterranea TaxID=74329 RepID=A0A7Z9C6C8_9CAUL|nr:MULTISPECIES: peptidylprolyl isomerase [Brevundimonas]MBU4239044.1 peptidylprolyl isomerase [Alphaproteobacteria bacterium]MCG2664326.1 peptidylprolyl isomerase [Brevundimonas sp.]VDC49699.1 Putative peptidyl-prolyl cis-trans isomerase [Brevundimonas mediterranea]